MMSNTACRQPQARQLSPRLLLLLGIIFRLPTILQVEKNPFGMYCVLIRTNSRKSGVQKQQTTQHFFADMGSLTACFSSFKYIGNF